MTKTIMILAIAAAFVAGSIATGTIAYAGGDDDDGGVLQTLLCPAGKALTGIVSGGGDDDDGGGILDLICEAQIEGPQGPAGADGMDGAPGADGNDGAPGADGMDGAAGADGMDGAAGADGMDGAPGADGMDGAKGDKGDKGDTGPVKIYTVKINKNPSGFDDVRIDVKCDSGDIATGGGGAGFSNNLADSNPTPVSDGSTPTGWTATFENIPSAFRNTEHIGFVLCADLPPLRP